MKKLLLLSVFICSIFSSQGQIYRESQYKNLGLLEKELAQAKNPNEKTNALIALFIHHSVHNDEKNIKAAEDYQQQLEIFTHQTNEPELIARAFLIFTATVRNQELKKRTDRLNDFAKLHNLSYYQAFARLRYASYFFTYNPDKNKAAQFVNDAVNLSRELSDSLKINILTTAGNLYTSMNNHLQALQLAYQAQELATKMRSPELMNRSNYVFVNIYYNLKDYSKAIEYGVKSLPLVRSLNKPHVLAGRHALIAQILFRSNQPVLGNYHVNEAYRLADSIKGSKRLYNQITGVTVGALTVSDSKEVLADFLKTYRKHFFIFPGSQFIDNVILASAYEKIGAIDSARFLINKASDYLTDNEQAENRKDYFYTLAVVASHDKNWNVAAANYKQSLQIALAQNNLIDCIQYTDSLKSTLEKQNLLPEALYYYKISDSLNSELAQQADKETITKQEVAGLEKERELHELQKEKEKQQRHNVQYLGITFGVVALFVSLLLLGLFRVSPTVIKILSFFSFLLFFEFIFLIFKKQVSVFTHGEPWKDLAFMVLLAAIMVPLHHWSEHKVVEYLRNSKISFPKTKFTFRKAAPKKEILIDE